MSLVAALIGCTSTQNLRFAGGGFGTVRGAAIHCASVLFLLKPYCSSLETTRCTKALFSDVYRRFFTRTGRAFSTSSSFIGSIFACAPGPGRSHRTSSNSVVSFCSSCRPHSDIPFFTAPVIMASAAVFFLLQSRLHQIRASHPRVLWMYRRFHHHGGRRSLEGDGFFRPQSLSGR